MKICVSTALAIVFSAGLVFGSTAHGFAEGPVYERPDTAATPAAKGEEQLDDDDLKVVVGEGAKDVIKTACAFFGGGVVGRSLVHKIAARAVLGVCGLPCGIGVGAVTVGCIIYTAM